VGFLYNQGLQLILEEGSFFLRLPGAQQERQQAQHGRLLLLDLLSPRPQIEVSLHEGSPLGQLLDVALQVVPLSLLLLDGPGELGGFAVKGFLLRLEIFLLGGVSDSNELGVIFVEEVVVALESVYLGPLLGSDLFLIF
jgi:hypothetical protein